MPIWLRKFTIQSLNEYFEKQAEQVKKQNNSSSKPLAKGPDINRSRYNVKARK